MHLNEFSPIDHHLCWAHIVLDVWTLNVSIVKWLNSLKCSLPCSLWCSFVSLYRVRVHTFFLCSPIRESFRPYAFLSGSRKYILYFGSVQFYPRGIWCATHYMTVSSQFDSLWKLVSEPEFLLLNLSNFLGISSPSQIYPIYLLIVYCQIDHSK